MPDFEKPGIVTFSRRLSGVILDNQALLEGLVELIALRAHQNRSSQRFRVGAYPLWTNADETGLHALYGRLALFLDGNDLTRLQAHRSNRGFFAVNQDVPMGDELTTLRSAGYQSGTEKNVVQTGFENLKHYSTCNALLRSCFTKYVEKLLFRNVVSPTNLLLFQQVGCVL